MSTDRQYTLFDVGKPSGPDVGPALVSGEIRDLGARLPRNIRLGTSSWSFPGWKGIVWDREATESRLSRRGLEPYGKHPVFRAVGIDRGYYAPVGAETFAEYASQVPADFRFVVKAAAECTSPWRREGGLESSSPNPRFFDPAWATTEIVSPMLAGLSDKAGPLVFQFSPLGPAVTRDPERFADRLGSFIAALPLDVWIAIELRDAELLCDAYAATLRETGASHCINIHPRMPPVEEQVEIAGSDREERLVVRWMLHSGLAYEQAKDRYAPFSRIIDPDPASRESLATLCVTRSRRGGETIIIANNKAEGSAPLTLIELARSIVQRNE